MQFSPSKVRSRQIPSTSSQDVGSGMLVGGTSVAVGSGVHAVITEKSSRNVRKTIRVRLVRFSFFINVVISPP